MPQIRPKWSPHSGQREVRESDARFRIVACGRRWGKTKLAAHELFEFGVNNPDSLCWWVAPEYRIADTGFRMLEKFIPDSHIVSKRLSEPKHIEIWNGTLYEFRSTAKEDGLLGEGVHRVVIDEAARVPNESVTREIRPTLSDTLGDMLAISTPRGRRGWFHEYFQRGQSEDEEWADFESWRQPTYQNPYVEDSEVDAAKREIPKRIFEQEYLAKFLDDSGGVFEKVRERVVEDYDWEAADGEAPYYIGVDFARHQDWTVIIVLDANARLVHYNRQRNTSWPQIQASIERMYERYPGRTYVDGSRDNKIVADLEHAGIEVEPINFTSQMKAKMVGNLVTAIENEEITLPDITQLISEMQMFEYQVTRAGNVSYHAPEGFHDDCVDALALANWAQSGVGHKPIVYSSKSAHVAKGSFLDQNRQGS